MFDEVLEVVDEERLLLEEGPGTLLENDDKEVVSPVLEIDVVEL